MKQVRLFSVAPWIPEELAFLETLARNMWWCWNLDAVELFRRIDPKLWKESGHNPIEFLSRVPRDQLKTLAEDDGFLSHLEQVMERFEAEVVRPRDARPKDAARECIAYFSLEYGIHESIRMYAGGLGCLSGDHLKAASDMNLPLVAVGLLYRHGYFRQYLNADGWQQESYDENGPHLLPISRACDDANKPVEIGIPLPDGILRAAVWRVDVGSVPLFLLDANIGENPEQFRRLTARLYEGDRTLRLRQEILLGIGGFRALLAMGYNPPVCHMNEGHAAFVPLARIEHLVKHQGMDQDAAAEVVSRSSIFTTHTPVPAGNEYFPADLLMPHLQALAKETGIPPQAVMSWGISGGAAHKQELCMTVLGLGLAKFNNAVSRLHGQVARRMWGHLWPGLPEQEIPIRHITNGVHVKSWISADIADLFDKYLGPEWRDDPSTEAMLARLSLIPNDELWHAHELARSRLIRIVRETAEKQYNVRGATRAELAQLKSALHHDALTIGFARRFAGYKRATLLLRDPQRLEAMLTNRDRPVQVIIAGKAHPADDHGKDMIRQIVRFAKSAAVRQHIIFVEDYDIFMARYMIQGADVWLNVPRRPQEASGTSGMKSGVNGVLNASILDGWWDEGYSADAGWAIGHGEEYENIEYQDSVESQALYNLLENEIIPCFYDRPDGDIPARWTGMMKASIKLTLSNFTSRRMVSEYDSLFYRQALAEHKSLLADGASRARGLVEQHRRLDSLWPTVKADLPVTSVDTSLLHVGDKFKVSASVLLGQMTPDEVDVEVYYGPVDADQRIKQGQVSAMRMAQDKGNGAYLYEQEIACDMPGRFGFTARVIPRGTDWKNSMPGFIAWAEQREQHGKLPNHDTHAHTGA